MSRAFVAHFAAACVIWMLLPNVAHAYLDPSTGSMILSGVLSVLVTTGLALQAYGYKLLGAIRRGLGRTAPAKPPDDAEGPPREREREPAA